MQEERPRSSRILAWCEVLKRLNGSDFIAAGVALAVWIAILAGWYRSDERWLFWSLVMFSGISALATALLCRYRIVRGRHISYGTLLLGPFAGIMTLYLGGAFYDQGLDVFDPDFWLEGKGALPALVMILVAVGPVCLLPAMTIIVFFQKRTKRGAGATC